MSNMSQLFDASRFPDDVKVRANGKATVMTLYGSENGSLRLFSLWEGAILSFRSGPWHRMKRLTFCC